MMVTSVGTLPNNAMPLRQQLLKAARKAPHKGEQEVGNETGLD